MKIDCVVCSSSISIDKNKMKKINEQSMSSPSSGISTVLHDGFLMQNLHWKQENINLDFESLFSPLQSRIEQDVRANHDQAQV